MKVALASTYPPLKCGIGTYTEKLARHMVAIDEVEDLRIISESGGQASHVDIGVDDCFKRRTAYSAMVVAAAKRRNADVVHFKHARDIWGMGDEFFETLDRLRRAGRQTVVTLHTVFTTRSGMVEGQFGVRRFHRRLAQSVSKIVVHTEGSRDILLRQGVSIRKIALIPHGTDPYEQGDRAAGREYLNVASDRKVLLFFGFIHMQKNIHTAVRAMPAILREMPEAHLVIAGTPGGDAWYNHLYLRRLKRMVKRLRIQDQVTIIAEFIEGDRIADIYAASDLLLCPHAQGYASASGVVHLAMTMKKPLICSDCIKFEEVAKHIDSDLLVPARKPKAWAKRAVEVLADGKNLDGVMRAMDDYSQRTFWDRIAAEHVALYRGIIPPGEFGDEPVSVHR